MEDLIEKQAEQYLYINSDQPLLAWRRWHINSDLVLKSLTRAIEWPKSTLSASCYELPHPAPREDCTCGVYGVLTCPSALIGGSWVKARLTYNGLQRQRKFRYLTYFLAILVAILAILAGHWVMGITLAGTIALLGQTLSHPWDALHRNDSGFLYGIVAMQGQIFVSHSDAHDAPVARASQAHILALFRPPTMSSGACRALAKRYGVPIYNEAQSELVQDQFKDAGRWLVENQKLRFATRKIIH